METPPTDQNVVPPGPPERRCPRCGSTLAPDQEWCLSCGAAAGTEVVEARGWRVPLYLGGGLAALAVIGVILAIVALASRKDEVAQTPSPSPGATAPPGATPSPLATITPVPSATVDPNATPTPDPTDPNATPTPTPSADPTETPTAEPTATPTVDSGTTSGDWTGADGDYTVIIESARSQSAADTVAEQARSKGHADAGVLNSDDFSSLNGGYHVAFVGAFASKSEAVAALDSIKADYPDAYVKRIKS